MLKIIAIIIVILIAGVLILAATKPNTFRVQREATIKAPPDKIFAVLNDFNRWGEWSPWEKKDPAMKRTFGAITSGKGATYAWDGNKDVGQGSMSIAESTAPSKLTLNLDFVKPMEGHNMVEFTLEPKGDMTHVVWAMHGPAPFVSKLFQVFCDMDRMVGKDFEEGLANLKAVTEK